MNGRQIAETGDASRIGASRARRSERLALGVAILGLVAWYVVLNISRPELVADEVYHADVIRELAEGDWSATQALPMLPTFHLLASLPARVLGDSLWVLRGFNTALGIAGVLLLYAAGRAATGTSGPRQLLRFAWNPLLLPLWVLVYTDLAALVCVVAALNFHLRRRYPVAAIALVLACLIRQSSVVWVAMFAAWGVMELWPKHAGGADLLRGNAAAVLRRALAVYWPYLAAFVVGCGLLVLTGRLAGHVSIENRPRLNPAQYYMFALTAALLWAPAWLAHFASLWPRLFEPAFLRPWLCAAAVAAVGVLELAFRNPHPWNVDLEYLRNWPLLAMMKYATARYLAAVCIVAFAATVVHMVWTSERRRTLGLIWVFTLLFLGGHYLVDPRYYVIPLVLLDFYTTFTPGRARGVTVWYLLITLALAGVMVIRPGGWSGVW